MIQTSLAVVLFLLAITAIACNRSDDSDSNAPALSGTTAMARSNEDLESAVKAKFKADEQLRSADLAVRADSTHNQITLSGSVESQALRSKAVDLAKTVDTGLTVNDQIEVKPSGRTANDPRAEQHHA
jgi:osmotically-inducible protein OsmY